MSLHATCARVIEKCSANPQQLSLRRIVESECANKDEKERKAVFAIVCQVLKFKDPIKTLITNSALPPSASKGKKEAIYLVMVYELLFGSGFKSAPTSLRALIVPHKTRLTAELAKLKIKKRAARNEDLLPDHVKNAVILPRYGRVNTNITTMDEVIAHLQKSGYSLIEYQKGINLGKLPDARSRLNTVVKDPHIPNLLILPPNSDFHNHNLLIGGFIILQDKASCFPAHLLNPPVNATVIDACAAPGNKTSHLSMLMKNTGTIFAFDKDKLRLQTLVKLTGRAQCKNIKPSHTSFLDVDPKDEIYANVTHILLDPSCSGSGITRRLDHLLVQAEQTIEDEVGGTEGFFATQDEESRVKALSDFQVEVILHSFKFPNVQRGEDLLYGQQAHLFSYSFPVSYSTCSKHQQENEGVVNRVLKSNRNFKLVENPFPEWKRR
ncbi:putative 28S rRNA (cytosine-C(5))-methyltransferase, partial [Entophlyctis sp. JEL0112]